MNAPARPSPARPSPARMSPAWADAALAAALFAVDPVGLRGVIVRSGAGTVRDRWAEMVRDLLPADAPVCRIPLGIEDDRLLGGLDLAASLAAGRPVVQHGVLAQTDGGVAILAMAERIDAAAAARLAAALDHGEVIVERDGVALRLAARLGMIAYDEGLAPEEQPPAALVERLAFRIDLDVVASRTALDAAHDRTALDQARDRLASVAPADPDIVEAVCLVAARLGLGSVRAPLLALRAARAHAALRGGLTITAEDAAAAARLVLAWRATSAPAEPEADAAPPEADNAPDAPPDVQDRDEDQDPRDGETESAAPTDTVVEAIQAALPDDLLSRLSLDDPPRGTAAQARGSGDVAKSARRGRPMGSRSGSLRAGARLNLVETLRAAAPWQGLRGGGVAAGRIQVRPADFRIRRFVQRLEATTIFAVDASGSTAFQRLAEAKGAVELLLAKAYVSRARVALIAFRGAGAETLLPPTRSLARAKSRLAELPGGGGTPLAAGVEAAVLLGQAERAKDHTPLLVFLTDGRANIARDGAPGRAAAETDALAACRNLREAGLAAVFVDTSPRAQPDGDRFAHAMGATYLPLPYVDASAVFGLVDGLRAARR
ncbi:magnesium chelatase subunit D [Phenylobacterium sp.]|uniref:magnesium chelatase subunit D n=1 Tax=Phenylobacterium sp. TaxID=1871053 RepID=UPI0025D1122A|nr:magnesium chelatase subunit D [Phenylobacterium sp.]